MGDCEESVLSKVTLVSGARGVVGYPLCEEFKRRGCHVVAVSRNDYATEEGLKWDMEYEKLTPIAAIESIDTMVHCAPIWLLPRHLQSLANLGLRRLIVFSSSFTIYVSFCIIQRNLVYINILTKYIINEFFVESIK